MSDDQRYIEYLQSLLLSNGWERFFSENSSARQSDVGSLLEFLRTHPILGVHMDDSRCAAVRASYTDLLREADWSKFDQPDRDLIFRPILDRVAAAAARIQWKTSLPVRIATSTDISPSPFARPSTTEHLLFIGPGTGKFCNAWAKAFTMIADSVWEKDGGARVPTIEEIVERSKSKPIGLTFAFALVIQYSRAETAMGVNDLVAETLRSLGHRELLLDAMEVFVVAHEYAHFAVAEREPKYSDVLHDDEAYTLEEICDLIGSCISIESAAIGNNYYSKCGLGSLLFLRAIEMCEAARTMIHGKSTNGSGVHPPVAARIANIRGLLEKRLSSKIWIEAQRHYEAWDAIARAVGSILLGIITNVKRAG